MSDVVDGAEIPRDRRVAVILRNVQCALDAKPDAEAQNGSGQA